MFIIRKEPSELSEKVEPFEKLIYDEILDPFFKDLSLTLLFLRNIERIEVYEIINQKNKLIGSTFIDYKSSSSDLKQKREAIRYTASLSRLFRKMRSLKSQKLIANCL